HAPARAARGFLGGRNSFGRAVAALCWAASVRRTGALPHLERLARGRLAWDLGSDRSRVRTDDRVLDGARSGAVGAAPRGCAWADARPLHRRGYRRRPRGPGAPIAGRP